MPLDAARLFQTSAEGGHAGPGSSWSYIHQIEEPLAHWMRKARPMAWSESQTSILDTVLFPDIGQGVLLPPRASPPRSSVPEKETSQEKKDKLQLSVRVDVARRLVAGETFEQVAGRCRIEVSDVRRCLDSIVLSLVELNLAEEESMGSARRQIGAIFRRRTWIAAAQHPKLTSVRAALDRLASDDRCAAMNELWRAWRRCHRAGEVNLVLPHQSSVLLGFLSKAGVLRKSLAVTAAPEALPLPIHLAERKLAVRGCKSRPGSPKYRLALTSSSVLASRGMARQVSTKGLSWLFVLAGSAVLSKEYWRV